MQYFIAIFVIKMFIAIYVFLKYYFVDASFVEIY